MFSLSARLTTVAMVGLISLCAAGRLASAQQIPPAPDPVPVTLTAATSALVVLDIAPQTCGSQPRCTQGMVPNIVSLLASARAAGAYVVYSIPSATASVLPAVAPQPGDPVFVGHGQDRFFNTDLDSMLQSHGISTVVLVGWRADGSVLYTSVGATLRGYTVVVPEDGTSAAQDYDVAIGRYMMLTQLNSNPTNDPLKTDAVTLSRTDLITFR
jgi:nicotinamidase-related amidase